MRKKSEYYQIITSLPLLQGKLNSDFDHLTRINFNKRLKNLKPEDLKMVNDLEDFVIWERHCMDNATDVEFKRLAIGLIKRYSNKTFLNIVTLTTRKRLLFGLLRKRKNGMKEAPNLQELWAFPAIQYNIKHHWDKVDFGLKNMTKELAGFDELIRNDEALLLEKQILELMWGYCDRLSVGHYFDINFILIYAIRRNIVERWNIINTPQDITEKFNNLAMEAINGEAENANS